MSSRRNVLRRGAGLLAVGSAAGVGSLSVGSDDGERSADSRTANALVAGSLQTVATGVGGATVEAHGSVACRRLLEDGLRDPDAVALADPRLFDGLAERATVFAANALVVAVNPDSPAAEYAASGGETTDRDDWRGLLADPALALGRTDPDRDPLGYRTVMALDLADGIDAAAVRARSQVFPETGLLRTLEAGGLDAAFAYRNMAVEHDLPFLALPDGIDFSNPRLADEYASASVSLDDRTVSGSPIRYAAHARTDRGRRWVRTLTSARETLRNAGFVVPDGYPRTRKIRGH
ncbi:extracellular solute-binding protein [Halorussus aquaticus]|uniref:Extracellular solute-binding protein n=1 Tax=Halorussus aquaticus TaxID=2953748 RepID=A0ABD5PWW6_9EURY|nr:extracellular solute-binding protein [Halorussus aquaticus]